MSWTGLLVLADLAKNVMQIHAVDSAERVVVRKAIPRERFVSWFANLEPCLIAMEARWCGALLGTQTIRARA